MKTRRAGQIDRAQGSPTAESAQTNTAAANEKAASRPRPNCGNPPRCSKKRTCPQRGKAGDAGQTATQAPARWVRANGRRCRLIWVLRRRTPLRARLTPDRQQPSPDAGRPRVQQFRAHDRVPTPSNSAADARGGAASTGEPARRSSPSAIGFNSRSIRRAAGHRTSSPTN